MKKILILFLLSITNLFSAYVYDPVDTFTSSINHGTNGQVNLSKVVDSAGTGYIYTYSIKYPENANYLKHDSANGLIGAGFCNYEGGYYLDSTAGCGCNSPLVEDTATYTCVCPAGLEKTFSQDCPNSENSVVSCELPCEDGYQRNSAGGCCPIGLDVFCEVNATGWSECKCPNGSYPVDYGTGEYGCIACDENETVSPDGECMPICTICNGAEQQAEQACQQSGQYLTDFECLPNLECTDFTVSGNCVNSPSCTECEDRFSTRQSECSASGSYLDNSFECSENTETCEVTNYNAGQCIDDDTNPLDPNHGDGSQDNNDDTNDIPDTDNTGGATPIDSDNDPSNGNDGNGGFDIEFPDYNPALETIGDNVEDVTKAINAQTQSLKDFQDVMDKATEKIDDSINDLTEGEINVDFMPDFDTDSGFIDKIDDAISGKLNDFSDYVKGLYQEQKDKYFNQTYVNKTCSSVPTVSFNIFGTDHIIMSQVKLEEFGIITTLRSIIIFMFVISGVLVALRGD